MIAEEDEESFIHHEEQFIYTVQALLHSKEGLETKPILETAAKFEDLLYHQTLRKFSLSATANVWTKKEYIAYYIEQTDKFLSQLKQKNLNWKKLFEDYEKTPQKFLDQIMKDDEGKRKSVGGGGNKATKAVKSGESKESLQNPAPGTLSSGPPTTKPKGPKAGGVKVKAEGKAGGAKGGKKKGAIPAVKEETTLSLDAAMDDINMFAGPTNTEPFDDNLFGSGDVELFGENDLEMDLFPFGSADDDPLKF